MATRWATHWAPPGVRPHQLTGSPRIGTLIRQAAAERHCPVTLELGGKSQIVFADADLDAAVPVIVNAIVQNSGQTCSAGSRLLIDSLIYGRCWSVWPRPSSPCAWAPRPWISIWAR